MLHQQVNFIGEVLFHVNKNEKKNFNVLILLVLLILPSSSAVVLTENTLLYSSASNSSILVDISSLDCETINVTSSQIDLFNCEFIDGYRSSEFDYSQQVNNNTVTGSYLLSLYGFQDTEGYSLFRVLLISVVSISLVLYFKKLFGY